MKLSPTMQKAMDALPLRYSVWGARVMSSNFPDGVTMKTINALQDRGLVEIKQDGAFGRKVVKK